MDEVKAKPSIESVTLKYTDGRVASKSFPEGSQVTIIAVFYKEEKVIWK